MHLSTVMLTIIAILALVSGALVFLGAEKGKRRFAAVFTVFCFAAAAWALMPYFPRDSWGWLLISCLALAIISGAIYAVLSHKYYRKVRRTRAGQGWKLLRDFSIVVALSEILNFYVFPKMFLNKFEFGYYGSWFLGFVILTLYIIGFYALILKYRLINVRNSVLKVWTYVVCIAVAVAVYMLLLFVVSKYLFHIEASSDLLAINLIMIIIVALLFPVVLEIIGTINSLIKVQKVDITYVIKKLNRLATQNVRKDRLAELLADYLHFKYIGIIIDGKIYETTKQKFSPEELAEISMLEAAPKNIWQKSEGHTKEIFAEHEIKAVAELRNAKGRPFGQILIGQPLGKVEFEKRDLSELEIILNLVASIVDSEVRLEV